MTEKEIIQIKELLNSSPKNIVITTHRNPDGDAMGSSLGLYHFLILKKHTVNVVTPTEYPAFLHWLPGNDKVIDHIAAKARAEEIITKSDVIFCLDFNALSRTYKLHSVLEKSKAIKILIDHHPQPEDFAEYSLSDTYACSTAELIFDFICMLDDEQLLSKDIATCLYTGIMTDTGSFSHASTTAKSHKIAAVMIEAGADNGKIHDLIYHSNSDDRMRFLGYCLSEKLKVLPEYKTAYISITKEELKKFNHKRGDTEGLVNYATSIDNICFSAL
ncbi:DHH family phosphoesterase, partial [bacterium AH-315-M05]|nr:DHH family phosphoesterase [bacterium AH-315-M05]